MQWCTFTILILLISTLQGQRLVEVQKDDGSYSIGLTSNSLGDPGDSVAALVTKASGWTERSGRAGLNGDVNFNVPNILASGVQIASQVPYVEILKLVESFIRLKGELAGRFWDLINDNAHILTAVRDTLVSKISTLHNLTLKTIIVLRKVLEFACSLFGNFNFNVGSPGSLFNAGVAFG